MLLYVYIVFISGNNGFSRATKSSNFSKIYRVPEHIASQLQYVLAFIKENKKSQDAVKHN